MNLHLCGLKHTTTQANLNTTRRLCDEGPPASQGLLQKMSDASIMFAINPLYLSDCSLLTSSTAVMNVAEMEQYTTATTTAVLCLKSSRC